jgi:hypothetical protein
LSKKNHIEILKIFKNNSSIKLNENKNGVYINLSLIPTETIDEIQNFVTYITDQETCLQTLEIQKKELRETYGSL